MYYSSGWKDWLERLKPYLIIGGLVILILIFLILSIKTTLRYFIHDYSIHLEDALNINGDENVDSGLSTLNIFKSDLKGKLITPTVYYEGYASASYSQGNKLNLAVSSKNELVQDFNISVPLTSVPIFNASTMRMESPDNFVASTKSAPQDVRVFFDRMDTSAPQVIIVNEEDAGKKLLCIRVERAVFNYDLQELQVVSSFNNVKVTLTNSMGLSSALSGDLVYPDTVSRGDYLVFDASAPTSDVLNIGSDGRVVSDASKRVSDKGLVGEVGNYIEIDDNTYYYDYITYSVDNAVIF